MVRVKPMLAKNLVGKPKVGWYMSEKYDGVRGLWDGTHIRSRSGKIIPTPKWFLANFPAHTALDGELFLGRDKFADINGLTKRKDTSSPLWRKVKYYVFDTWSPHLLDEPFYRRYNAIKRIVANSCKRNRSKCPLQVVQQKPIRSVAQAQKFFRCIIDKGGEGLVVRDPDAKYEQKRSATLLKWKPQRDAEAKVVGFTEGKGRFAGQLGAMKVRTLTSPSRSFKLAGRIDAKFRAAYRFRNGKLTNVTNNPAYPRVGDIVTYQYMTLTHKGIPRQPVFMRIRHHAKRK